MMTEDAAGAPKPHAGQLTTTTYSPGAVDWPRWRRLWSMPTTTVNDCRRTIAEELLPWGRPPNAAAERILIVLHDFCGGGTERVAIRLANQWARAGRTVAIFCGNEAGPARAMVDDDVAVETVDPPLRRASLSRVRLGFALARSAERFRPDVIFAPGNFHMLVLAAYACRARRKVTTICKVSNPLVRGDRNGIAGWCRHLLLKLRTRRIDYLVAMSPALRAEILDLVEAERVATQWDPIVDDHSSEPARIVREPGLVVTIARLERQKNLRLAIEAMVYLSRWTDARLVILGEGRERGRLTRLIHALGLHGRVLLQGQVDNPKEWLQRASCFLMTSHYEGYPASLIEALACGTPVLITPCTPALDDILPHAPLTKVVGPDPGAIACVLQSMLQHPRFPSAEPALLARHDEARAAAAYLALMDDLLVRSARERT